MEQQPGYIDKQVLVKKVRRGDEEVLIMVRWESEEAWKNWEKSPEHIAGHKANAGKPKPDYFVESGQEVYYVKVKKALTICQGFFSVLLFHKYNFLFTSK